MPEASSIAQGSDRIDDDRIYHPELDVSQIDEKKLMRKVDFYVIPWLTVVYLFSFLDRGSIGNAKVSTALRNSLRLDYLKNFLALQYGE